MAQLRTKKAPFGNYGNKHCSSICIPYVPNNSLQEKRNQLSSQTFGAVWDNSIILFYCSVHSIEV